MASNNKERIMRKSFVLERNYGIYVSHVLTYIVL